MRLRFRFLWLLLRAVLKKEDIPPDGRYVLHFWLMPFDCVVLLAGNDRYHAFLDLCRFHVALVLGWWRKLLFGSWRAQLVSCSISHRAPLRVFERFTVSTRIIHFNTRFLWLIHTFESNNASIAIAVSKLTLQSHHASVNLRSVPHLFEANNYSLLDPTTISKLYWIEQFLKQHARSCS